MSRYIIEKNYVITINRGDYLSKTFRFVKDSFPEDIPLNVGPNDIIFFGLMDPNQHFEHALIKKEFLNAVNNEGEFILELESEDTLELVPGVYYYSIKLLREDSKIETLVPKTKFIIVD